MFSKPQFEAMREVHLLYYSHEPGSLRIHLKNA